jgi:hypothetical protein
VTSWANFVRFPLKCVGVFLTKKRSHPRVDLRFLRSAFFAGVACFCHTHRLFRHIPKTATNTFVKDAKNFRRFRNGKTNRKASNGLGCCCDLWWVTRFFPFFLCWRETRLCLPTPSEKIGILHTQFAVFGVNGVKWCAMVRRNRPLLRKDPKSTMVTVRNTSSFELRPRFSFLFRLCSTGIEPDVCASIFDVLPVVLWSPRRETR